jgi:hypothetical protein
MFIDMPNEEQIRKIVKEELQAHFGNDKYIFSKLIQIMDGRNIVVGKGVGTKIATETTQKLGFFGKTPIVQVSAISTPSAPGSTYLQADAQSMKTAVDAIRTAFINLGLTA